MRQRTGFTILELTIVLALVAIIAAIAVPNLIQSRLRVNEAAAVTRLKSYSTAQETFQRGGNGKVFAADGTAINTLAGPSAYCDNYRNLYYGVPVGGIPGTTLLQLIAREHADAYGYGADEENDPATVNPPAKTVGGQQLPAGANDALAPGVGVPYKGYYFFTPGGLPGPNSRTTGINPEIEDDLDTADVQENLIQYGRREPWFSTQYGQLAAPALSGSTGASAFYIGTDGRVWRRALPAGQDIGANRLAVGIRQVNPAAMLTNEYNASARARVEEARRSWFRQ